MNKDKQTEKKIEERCNEIRNFEIRSKGEGKGMTVTGYTAVFDTFTTITDRWGDTFQEKIEKGAFAKSLSHNDIYAIYNHDWNNVIGRSGVNMKLEEDDFGLRFEIDLPDTTFATDLGKLIRSNIISQCSFGGYVEKDAWDFKGEEAFRTLKDIDLSEMTITPRGAYSTTSAEVRSHKPIDKPVDTAWEKKKAEILAKYGDNAK